MTTVAVFRCGDTTTPLKQVLPRECDAVHLFDALPTGDQTGLEALPVTWFRPQFGAGNSVAEFAASRARSIADALTGCSAVIVVADVNARFHRSAMVKLLGKVLRKDADTFGPKLGSRVVVGHVTQADVDKRLGGLGFVVVKKTNTPDTDTLTSKPFALPSLK